MRILADLAGICLGLGMLIFSFPKVSAQTAETDSLSYAASSIMAGYLLDDVPSDTVHKADYLAGLHDALTTSQNRSYYYGMLNGIALKERIASLNAMLLPVNRELVFAYLIQMLTDGNTGGLNNEQANDILNNYLAENYVSEPDTLNRVDEQLFVDSIATLPGARRYPSGIVILTLNEDDDGVAPKVGQTVMVSYEGRLSDGSVFDATEEPIEMLVGGLVKGFNEALTYMKTGGTYRLVIPAELGYGESGIQGVIPGNASLDFTLTLMKNAN